MGLEESRLSGGAGGSSRDDSGGGSSGCRYPRQVLRRCPPWACAQQCGLQDWTLGQHEKLNFDLPVLTCTSQLYSECFPGFCIRRQDLIPLSKKCLPSPPPAVSTAAAARFARPPKRVKFAKMAQHLEYNHIPASLSSIQRFRVKAVLCHRGSLMVLHLVRNMASQFGIVDVRANKFLGIFAKQSLELPVETVRGEIAPDETHCLLLMPSVRHRPQRLDVLMLCDLQTREILSEMVVPSYLTGGRCQFAFDPRFTCNRIAVSIGSVGQQGENDADQPQAQQPHQWRQSTQLSLYDSRAWRKLRATTSAAAAAGQSVRRLQFSRAGHLLLAVVTDDYGDAGGCHCRGGGGGGDRRQQLFAFQLMVHDGQSLARLRRIPYQRAACPEHSCPAAFCPAVSRCGSRLAFVVNGGRQGASVLVRQLPQPPTLRAMAREVVLQMWSDQALSNQLALPNSLLIYLRFRPEFSCAGCCDPRSCPNCC